MVAYMPSPAPAAVIGAIYAHAILFVVTPDAVFGVLVIVQTLVVCLVGGVGSKWGPLSGSGIMVPMSEMLDATVGDQLPGIQGVVYGAALVLVMLCAPEGIYWRLRAWRPARRAVEPPRVRAAAPRIDTIVAGPPRGGGGAPAPGGAGGSPAFPPPPPPRRGGLRPPAGAGPRGLGPHGARQN